MMWKKIRVYRENFLWVPFLIISIVNVLYLVMASLIVLTRITDVNLRTIELRQEEPLRFFLSSIIIDGWGIPVILISNLGGAILGLLMALVYRRRVPENRKKSIKIFLIFFYTMIFGSLAFLMLSN